MERLMVVSAVFCLATGCASAPNRLEHVEVESVAVPWTMAYEVWAPQDMSEDERLPLVVFLHGGGDSENSFDQAGIGQHLDEQLAQGRIPRVVIVVPRGEMGFWENWHDGSRSYRNWVIDEVIPTVQADYHTQTCPQGCHVGGVSMGGHGTMRFAWFHPDVFSSASALSAPIFDSAAIADFTGQAILQLLIPFNDIWGPTDDLERIRSEDLYLQWRSQADLKGVRLFLGVAKNDRAALIDLNRKFHAHLDESKIEHTYLEFEGRHKWVSWTPVIDQVLRFAVWGSIDAGLEVAP